MHEFGHLLHLDDEHTAKDVMQPTITPGLIRQRLGPDDVAGIKHLYPMLSGFEISQLATEASVIVRGTVLASGYAVFTLRLPFNDVNFDIAFSVHRIRVDSRLKWTGPLQDEIDVLTMGGQTPTYSFRVDSEAEISPNEEVVVFLSEDHRAIKWPHSSGIWHGDFSLPFVLHYPLGLDLFLPHGSRSFSIFGGFQGKYSVYRRGDISYVWRPGLPPAANEGLTLASFQTQMGLG